MLAKFLLPNPMGLNAYIYLLQWNVVTFPLEIWSFTEALSFVNICPSQHFPGALSSWLRASGTDSQASASSTAYTGGTQSTGGQDSYQVPWCMVLYPTTPTETLLSIDKC